MRHIFATVLLLGAVALTGCSSFDREWKAAAALDTANDPALGRWQGRWHSEPTNHEGDLRAIVTKGDKGQYQARFRAQWSIFHGEFESELVGQPENGVLKFTAEQDLGVWGQYHGEGSADGKLFHAAFTKPDGGDKGVFDMTRPTP